MQGIIKEIVDTFDARGGEKYADEEVTQEQHALQCATLAIEQGSPETLVAAALLHDIGHILGDSALPEDCDQDLHDRHESSGYHFLRRHFGDAVAEPVRLHVAAKRYLCTTDPAYCDELSPTSLKSFHDQGGMMSELELDEFRASPFFEDAVRLRRWDDTAKIADLETEPVEHFVPLLRRSLVGSAEA